MPRDIVYSSFLLLLKSAVESLSEISISITVFLSSRILASLLLIITKFYIADVKKGLQEMNFMKLKEFNKCMP